MEEKFSFEENMAELNKIVAELEKVIFLLKKRLNFTAEAWSFQRSAKNSSVRLK